MNDDQINKLQFDEMHQGVCQIILPIGQFYRASPDDKSRYFADLGILELLSLIAINLALPILTGITTNLIYDKVKKNLIGDEVKKSVALGEKYIKEINQSDLKQEILLILSVKPVKQIENSRRRDAIEIVQKLLLYHGCPKRRVEKLSEDIVEKIILTLENENY